MIENRKMVATSKKQIPCEGCGTLCEIPENFTDWKCPNCKRHAAFRNCDKCSEVFQIPFSSMRQEIYECPFCKEETKTPRFGKPKIVTALQANATLLKFNKLSAEHGLNRIIRNCFIVGGYGHSIHDRTSLSLIARGENLNLFGDNEIEYASYSINSLKYFEIDGPGKVSSGGGFMGGGFGVVGAIQGMLMASVLNAVTTGTTITTNIKIVIKDFEFLLINKELNPDQVKSVMSPVLETMRLNQSRTSKLDTSVKSLSLELKELAELHRDGVLNEVEFQLAKAKLLM